MDEGRHGNVIAWFCLPPPLPSVFRIDELGVSRDDIDPGFALAMVVGSRRHARRDMRLAHPDRAAANRIARQGGHARHARCLRGGGRTRLRWYVVKPPHGSNDTSIEDG